MSEPDAMPPQGKGKPVGAEQGEKRKILPNKELRYAHNTDATD